MKLDLTPLEDAVAQLEEALDIYHSDLALNHPRLKRHLRAAVIQAFAFTYELCFRMLKSYLEFASANPAEIDEFVFNDVIRAFETALGPLMNRILGNMTESRTLAAQRDALLPGLVSGEVTSQKLLYPNFQA